MLFFSINASDVLESDASDAKALADAGYYEVLLPSYDRMLYTITVGAETLIFHKSSNKFVYTGAFTKVANYDAIYLEYIKEKTTQLFEEALAILDTKATRPAQYIALSMAVEEAANADDVDRLWQYEECKEENRKLLAQLTAATTWEEAEAIKPWMPWEAATPSQNPHRPAEQHVYGIDNARLPS